MRCSTRCVWRVRVRVRACLMLPPCPQVLPRPCSVRLHVVMGEIPV